MLGELLEDIRCSLLNRHCSRPAPSPSPQLSFGGDRCGWALGIAERAAPPGALDRDCGAGWKEGARNGERRAPHALPSRPHHCYPVSALPE